MDHLTPTLAFAFLQQHPDALFIDCRTEMEYLFVGHPIGAQHVPWQEAPDWEFNPAFVADVRALAGSDIRPVVLICRSGRRSVEAGVALEAAGLTTVINVLDGFEGELDENQHRGTLGGWRLEGLPWEQF
jgi:rhodanese-related sulfurtransferase